MPRVTVDAVPSRPNRYMCPDCGQPADLLMVALGNWAQVWCPNCRKEGIAKPVEHGVYDEPTSHEVYEGRMGDARARPKGVAGAKTTDRPVAGQVGFLPGPDASPASSDQGRGDSESGDRPPIGGTR